MRILFQLMRLLNKSKSDKSIKEYTATQEQRRKDLAAQNQKANRKNKK